MHNLAVVASSDSGRQVGDLELVAPLSVDGLAELFLATAPGGGTLKKFVLLQQLCHPFRDDPEFTRRFLDDARLTAGLTHPNVVRVLKLGRDPARGDPYLATELVGGKSLAGLVKVAEQHGFQLPLPLACRIVHDLCLGLQAAHELADASGASLGVVHGDVTPRNVLVTFDGHAKVLDLGISRARRELRLTHPDLAKGTLGYISPEQVLGHPIDARTDLFAAATILFELISGRKMFPNELAAPHAVVMERPPAPSTLAPDVPPDLDDAVLRALEKNPDQRHASAYDFACALAAAVPLAPTHEVSELMTRLFADDQQATQALLATLAADDPDERALYAWLSRWEGEGVTPRPPPIRPVAPVRAAAAWPAELAPPPEPAAAWPAELSPPPAQPAVAWPAELSPPPPEPAAAWPGPPTGPPGWPAALEAAPGATWSTEFAAPPGRLHTSTTPAWPSVLAPPPIAPVADEPLAAASPGLRPPPRAAAAPAPALDEPLAPAASWPAQLAPPPATTRPAAPARSAWPSELAAPPGPGARLSGPPAASETAASAPPAPAPAAAWPAELSTAPDPAAAWPAELAAAPDPAAAWPAELSAAPAPAAWPAELSAPPAPAVAPGRPPAADWPSELAPPPPRAAAADLPPPPGVSWPAEVPAEAAAKPERARPPKTGPVLQPTAPGETSSVEAAPPQSKAKLIVALALLLVAIALFVAWYTGAIGARPLPPPRVEEPAR